MAAINKKLSIKHKGEKYSVLIDMRAIDELEDSINLATFARRLSSGDIRLSHTAKFFSCLLSLAGANTTQEEVYTEMFNGGEESIADAIDACSVAMSCVFPDLSDDSEEGDGKKPK